MIHDRAMSHCSSDELHCNATTAIAVCSSIDCRHHHQTADELPEAATAVDALLQQKRGEMDIRSPLSVSTAKSAPTTSADGGCTTARKATAGTKTTKKKASKKTKKKHVRWSTITVHEFGVGLGGGAVPSKGGPSIGLADAPEFTWVTKVGEMAECSEGVHRFTSNQRTRLLQSAGVADAMIERYARETSIILNSRRRTFLEDLAEERKEKSRKRNAEQALLERPCSVSLRRPSMIPANYV